MTCRVTVQSITWVATIAILSSQAVDTITECISGSDAKFVRQMITVRKRYLDVSKSCTQLRHLQTPQRAHFGITIDLLNLEFVVKNFVLATISPKSFLVLDAESFCLPWIPIESSVDVSSRRWNRPIVSVSRGDSYYHSRSSTTVTIIVWTAGFRRLVRLTYIITRDDNTVSRMRFFLVFRFNRVSTCYKIILI